MLLKDNKKPTFMCQIPKHLPGDSTSTEARQVAKKKKPAITTQTSGVDSLVYINKIHNVDQVD